MKKLFNINDILLIITITFILCLVLFPLTWIFLASLKTQNEVYLFKWFPNEPQWINTYKLTVPIQPRKTNQSLRGLNIKTPNQ